MEGMREIYTIDSHVWELGRPIRYNYEKSQIKFLGLDQVP